MLYQLDTHATIPSTCYDLFFYVSIPSLPYTFTTRLLDIHALLG